MLSEQKSNFTIIDGFFSYILEDVLIVKRSRENSHLDQEFRQSNFGCGGLF